MNKFLMLAVLCPSLACAEIDGLGFLKIGEQKSVIQKSMRIKGAEFAPVSYEEIPHSSMQPLKYRKVKLTSIFDLDDVELFFHKNKLFQIYAEVNPNPIAYSTEELGEMYIGIHKFENIISALKEKYKFSLDKEEENVVKANDSGCAMDILIKQTTWNIPAKVGLGAVYLEKKIFNPETKVELGSKEIHSDSCYETPLHALYIYDVKVLKEVGALTEKAIQEREQEEIRQRQKELRDL